MPMRTILMASVNTRWLKQIEAGPEQYTESHSLKAPFSNTDYHDLVSELHT